jgi:hypothetical protein
MSGSNPINDQDWETITLRAPKGTVFKDTPKEIVKKGNNAEAIRLAKLDNAEEPLKQKILSMGSRQELIKARVAKGLNQEKLANALSIQTTLYKDIENGKTIPAQNILSKINNFLGTKVKLG